MKKLLVQYFLETKTFQQLEDEHGVNVRFSKCGKKFSLNYDQLNSKETDVLAQECRGVILRMSDKRSLLSVASEKNGKPDFSNICPGETQIISYAFNRFFNFGQGAAANIDWKDPYLSAQNKEDGTFIQVYYSDLDDSWCVATRSMPDADHLIDNWNDLTFRKLFIEILTKTTNMSFKELTDQLDKDITYCFELCTSRNRIVIDYKEDQLFLIGMRNKISFEEICPFKNSDVLSNIPRPKIYDLNNINDIIEIVNSKNPIEPGGEGIVVRDSKFNRIKVKNVNYNFFNKARDVLGSSVRACLEIVLNEKEDDVLAMMSPEIQKTILSIKEKLSVFLKDFNHKYTLIQNQLKALSKSFSELKLEERKIFAILVQNSDIWTAPCFDIYSGKVVDVRSYIKSKAVKGVWSNSFLDQMLVNIKY